MCLKISCLPDSGKDSSMVPVFKNNEERSTAKSYYLVSLLSVLNIIFEKLVIIKVDDHHEK